MPPATPRPLAALAASAVALFASAAAAQHPVRSFVGAQPGDGLGFALARVADRDGDGKAELAVGVPKDDGGGFNAGAVLVLSSASGAELARFEGLGGDGLGSSVAAAGDVDGDGVQDLIAGAPSAGGASGAAQRGEVRVWSGQTGAQLHLFEGFLQFDRFGTAVAGAGDVDGDGKADLLIGSPLADAAGLDNGAVYVHSGADGHLIRGLTGDQDGDQLGTCVANVGDLDLDGWPDHAAGAPYFDFGGADAGMVRAWSGHTGAVLFTVPGPAPGAELGRAIVALDDLDGDGRPELALGAWRDPAGGPGAGSVAIVRGSDGVRIRLLVGEPGSGFGAALANAGDVDGDGKSDLLVGSPTEGGGAARVYSSASWSVIQHVVAVGSNERLGSALAGGFELDGDTRSEYAVGAWLADGPPAGAGRATLYSSVDGLGAGFCFGDGSGAPCPCGNLGGPEDGCANSTGAGALLTGAGSPSVAADDLVLQAIGLVPNQPALCFAGLNALNGGDGLLFGDGLRCVGGDLRRLGVQVPSASGVALYGPGLAAREGFLPGEQRRFQAWYRDPNVGPCGSGFNLSAGYAVVFVP